jgi:hypothetical protein
MRRRRVARVAAVVLGFPLLLAGLIAAYAGLFPDSNLVGTLGASIVLGGMVLFGMAANRWWACALPLLWAGVPMGIGRIVDLVAGGCSVCGSDDDWGNYPLIIFFVGVVPVTLALAVGVGIRRVAARVGSRDPDPPVVSNG